jgi:hypothetical protein
MEDIPRDVQKELDGYRVPKSSRQGRHWALLFVSEQGEVITIQKFKGLMLLALFVMVVALSVAGSLYMLYKKPLEENNRLVVALSGVEERVRALGGERDLLLTRLGIAEARIKKAGKPKGADKQVGKAAAEEEPAVRAGPVDLEIIIPPQETEKTEIEPEHEQKPRAPQPEETESEEIPEIKVDVRDLQVQHEPELNQLNVQFRLKNVNIEAGVVSGRTFVVLKTNATDETDILTFPKVTLVEGKPARIYLGRYFSISRFNIIKYKGEYDQPPRPFSSATVFVYSGAGDLLLEKSFSIENPFKNSEMAGPEVNESQAEEAGETEAGQGYIEMNNTILNN